MFIFTWLMVGLSVFAKEIPFEEAVRLLLTDHPDIVSLRAQEESTRYRSAQQLSPNNPTLNLQRNDVIGFSPFGNPASQQYNLTWTVGFPGKALYQSAATRRQSDALGEQAMAKESDLAGYLATLYFNYSVNQTLKDFLHDELDRSEQVLRVLERRYSLGQLSQVDLLNARTERAGLLQAILVNEEDAKLMLSRFLISLRRTQTQDWVPERMDVSIPIVRKSLSQLKEAMLNNRPALKALDFTVSAAQASLNASRMQPFPDFTLMTGMNDFYVDAAKQNPGVSRDYTFGIGISVPLFFIFNEYNGMSAARADRTSAEAQRDSARLQAMTDLETQSVKLSSATRELANLEKLVLPAAKAAYELALKAYALSKVSYVQLNDSRKSYRAVQADRLQKLLNVSQLHIQLLQQVGCDLTKRSQWHECI